MTINSVTVLCWLENIKLLVEFLSGFKSGNCLCAIIGGNELGFRLVCEPPTVVRKERTSAATREKPWIFLHSF